MHALGLILLLVTIGLLLISHKSSEYQAVILFAAGATAVIAIYLVLSTPTDPLQKKFSRFEQAVGFTLGEEVRQFLGDTTSGTVLLLQYQGVSKNMDNVGDLQEEGVRLAFKGCSLKVERGGPDFSKQDEAWKARVQESGFRLADFKEWCSAGKEPVAVISFIGFTGEDFESEGNLEKPLFISLIDPDHSAEEYYRNPRVHSVVKAHGRYVGTINPETAANLKQLFDMRFEKIEPLR